MMSWNKSGYGQSQSERPQVYVAHCRALSEAVTASAFVRPQRVGKPGGNGKAVL